jgi:hypothetical protein
MSHVIVLDYGLCRVKSLYPLSDVVCVDRDFSGVKTIARVKAVVDGLKLSMRLRKDLDPIDIYKVPIYQWDYR